MSRRCSVTGKKPQVGNHVSHANNKTKRRFLPNLQKTSLYSDQLDKMVRLRLSTYAIRCIEHRGNLDHFLLKAKDSVLSTKARQIKRRIIQARHKNEQNKEQASS